MVVYLGIIEEHTFDYKWDSINHYSTFSRKEDAKRWANEYGLKVANRHHAVFLDEFPDYPEDSEPFVCWDVVEQEVDINR